MKELLSVVRAEQGDGAQLIGSLIRLVQLVSPHKFKQPVIISAAIVTLSAIAHSVILWLPMPENDSPGTALPSLDPESTEMAVVILPEQAAVETLPPETANSPLAPSPESPLAPASEPATLLPTDVIPQPVSPQLEVSAPVPPPTPVESLNPSIKDLPVDDGDVTPAFTQPVPDGPLLSYGDHFPHVAGAVSGCFGLSECRQVRTGERYHTVARSLIVGLEDQGYGVKLRDDLEGNGRHVYEITAPDSQTANQYLLVFSGADGSAIYVMSPQIMTLDELELLATQASGNQSG